MTDPTNNLNNEDVPGAEIVAKRAPSCGMCRGSGFTTRTMTAVDNVGDPDLVECAICNGTGKLA